MGVSVWAKSSLRQREWMFDISVAARREQFTVAVHG